MSNIFNVLRYSLKRMENLRDSQKATIQEALYIGELMGLE